TLQEEESYGEMIMELSRAKTLKELRAIPAEEILRLNGELGAKLWQTLGNGMVIVPCVDGYVLPESVRDCYANGHMRQIPYMLGTVIDDLGSSPESIAADEPGLTHTENLRWSRKVHEIYGGNAWNYFFKRKLPGDDWGAFHSAELWYTFGTLGRCWRPMEEHDYALSRLMLDAWTSFMKTGDPNGGTCEGWRPYTDEDPYVREFE
ncbi:MAG: carboxylesterase family protein, partial [Blautia sp.]|nr:carboxylesterase family protein [Blautia sp.]